MLCPKLLANCEIGLLQIFRIGRSDSCKHVGGGKEEGKRGRGGGMPKKGSGDRREKTNGGERCTRGLVGAHRVIVGSIQSSSGVSGSSWLVGGRRGSSGSRRSWLAQATEV